MACQGQNKVCLITQGVCFEYPQRMFQIRTLAWVESRALGVLHLNCRVTLRNVPYLLDLSVPNSNMRRLDLSPPGSFLS